MYYAHVVVGLTKVAVEGFPLISPGFQAISTSPNCLTGAVIALSWSTPRSRARCRGNSVVGAVGIALRIPAVSIEPAVVPTAIHQNPQVKIAQIDASARHLTEIERGF
jgi:hypothetical protein